MSKPARDAIERFTEKVQRGEGCWLWLGVTNNCGYGRFHLPEKRMVLAHRFAFALRFGEIPSGLCVCHRCDNPRCVNPDHLFLGTNRDNARDMWAKGRGRTRMIKRTHCKHGHEYTPENTCFTGKGARTCRTCKILKDRRRRAEARRKKTQMAMVVGFAM